MIRLFIQCVGLLLLGVSPVVGAANVTGAGASLPYPVYARWADAYHKQTGTQVNYQSIGSGGGQQQIMAKTVDFGASDDPMSAEQLDQEQLLQFPAVIGGIVPVVNLAGIKPGDLKLTGPVLADIYLGRITHWNDSAIQELNPHLQLPARSIIVVHRADGSGTTFDWSSYLAKVSPQWDQQVGVGKAIKWPTGHGGKGNEGVAAYVRQLADSIGYVEYAYATQNNMAWVQLANQAGYYVSPSLASFTAAALDADWENTPGMGASLTNTAGEQAWPITAASFILMHKTQPNVAKAQTILNFFNWAFTEGADLAAQLDYVALPADLIEKIQQRWATELSTTTQQPLWPTTP